MSTAVALSPIKSIQQGLQTRRAIYLQALPKHVSVDRFMRGVLLACARDPKLLSCSQESLFQAVSQACQLGLDPSGILGSAYIIPYGSTATLVPGYRGLIDLARRSGQIVSLQAHAVHEGDRFRYQLGDDPKIEHEPSLAPAEGANVLYVYAVARLKDGGVQREVMTKAEIEAIRKKSKAGNSGPWRDHWEEMAKKTVIRRLVKLLPISAELAAIEQAEAAAEEDQNPEALLAALESGAEPPSARADALEAELDSREPGEE